MARPSNALSAALVFILAVLILGGTLFASPSGYSIFSVVSGSMEPAIPVGATIAVRKTKNHPLPPGSVITFTAGDILITHRIEDVGFDGEYYYITRGDANQNPDAAPVRPQQVLGRVDFVTPSHVVAVLRFLRNPAVLLVLIPALLIVWSHSSPKIQRAKNTNNAGRENQ
ncbi:MAG: signal peptidase I [Bacillota bacterium]|nr:signal peptidase I [Bacillota bacterium]MDW7684664.1 signal peptidase I [Bacillota bacterium]